MKRILLLLVGCFLLFNQPYCLAKEDKANILVLIAEQNIEGPQQAWWASSIDLSTFESRLSTILLMNNYSVLNPRQLTKVLRRERAFSRLDISDEESVKLAELSQADYVVLGKAVATAGSKVPESNMRSCFANATAKLFRVNDAEIIAYLASSGSSVHVDVITGGQEALDKAAEGMAIKIINALSHQRREK